MNKDELMDLVYKHKVNFDLDDRWTLYEEFKRVLKTSYNADDISEFDYDELLKLYIEVVGL